MAFTYDNKNTVARGRNSSGVNISITLGSGATLVVLAVVTGGLTARTGGVPIFDPGGLNLNMSPADQLRSASSGETVVELYYCFISGVTGAKTIWVPDANNVYLSLDVASFKSAAGTVPALRTANGTTGTSTNPAGPTHSGLATGDVIVSVVGSGATTWTDLTAQTGTPIYNVDDGSYGHGSQYYLTPDTANCTPGWTHAANDDWAIVSAVFKEVALAYKDYSGTAGTSSSTSDAHVNRYANFVGTAALASTTPDAHLVRYANFAGVAGLTSQTPDADLGRTLPFAGTAAIVSSIPDADAGLYAEFVGTAALVSQVLDANLTVGLVQVYKDFAGTAVIASSTPDAHLSRYAGFIGAVTLATSTPDADINRYANFAGTVGLSSSTPNAHINRYANLTGTVSATASTLDIHLARYAGFVGAVTLVSETPDADLEIQGGGYKNFVGTATAVTSIPEADISRILGLTGVVQVSSATVQARLGRTGEIAGTVQVAAQVPNATLNRYVGFIGTVSLDTFIPEAAQSGLNNFVGLAELVSLISDADLGIGGAADKLFLGTCIINAGVPDAALNRCANYVGTAAVSTSTLGEIDMSGRYYWYKPTLPRLSGQTITKLASDLTLIRLSALSKARL